MYQLTITTEIRSKMLHELREQISELMPDDQLALLGAGRIAFAILPWGLPDERVQYCAYFASDYPDRAIEEHYSLWRYDRDEGPGPYEPLCLAILDELYDMSLQTLTKLSLPRLSRCAPSVRAAVLRTLDQEFEEACMRWEEKRAAEAEKFASLDDEPVNC